MLQAAKLNLKAMGVVMRLTRLTQGPLSYRLNAIKKYYSFYIYHTHLQQAKFNSNLLQIQQEILQQTYGNRIKSLYCRYSQKLKTQLEQKVQSAREKQASQYEKQAQNLLRSGMSYLSLYYESLQNMIEGRRQVLHNTSFKFQDGQTVDQKRIAFEKYLSRLLGRKQSEIDRIEKEYQAKKQEQNLN